MNETEITINQWNEYLDDLYAWVQEKYELFAVDKIDEDQYNEHLHYYLKEKDRIEKIIESLQNTAQVSPQLLDGDLADENDHELEDRSKENELLNQRKFEEFFGVSLEEELSKIEEDQEQEPQKKENSEPIEDMWKYVKADRPEDFEDGTMKGEKAKNSIDHEIRILLIGDSAVGRTSLRRSWMGKHFVESHLTTIGASIDSKIITIDGEVYEVTITDLGGQDFYSGLRRNFYRNIDGAILVFDLTRPDTFRRLDFWIKEMYRELKTLVPFILVGNKKDDENRKISEKHGSRASAQFSRTTLPKFRVRYMETSAKTGENVDRIFETIALEIRELRSS